MTTLPSDLSTARAKLVYLYLESTGGATVEELRDALDIPLITILPTVEVLVERSLVEVRDGQYLPARSARAPAIR